MGSIAIIPARGGSKRIPGKNIKDFLGKPIIAYSIEAAINSGLFTEVMVSTDSEEIAEVAKKYGAKVPFIRSSKNADDFATTIDVLLEVLENYKGEKHMDFDYGCCIYPTAPFTSADHLKTGFLKMENQKLDIVFPVVAFSYPIWRGLEVVDGEKVKMIWPEYLNTRSQDLKKVFHDAGQWYWFNTSTLKDTLYTNNSGYVALDEKHVQDIDTETDWELAEMKFRIIHKDGKETSHKG